MKWLISFALDDRFVALSATLYCMYGEALVQELGNLLFTLYYAVAIDTSVRKSSPEKQYPSCSRVCLTVCTCLKTARSTRLKAAYKTAVALSITMQQRAAAATA